MKTNVVLFTLTMGWSLAATAAESRCPLIPMGAITGKPSHPTPVNLERKPALLFRYFDGAETEYQAATGRKLRADVQAYLTDNTKDEVWTVYYRLLGERFRRAYFDPIRAWCDRVGLPSCRRRLAWVRFGSKASLISRAGSPTQPTWRSHPMQMA